MEIDRSHFDYAVGIFLCPAAGVKSNGKSRFGAGISNRPRYNRKIAKVRERCFGVCVGGGMLGGGKTVVVKVARPKQDMRFDVPTIGPETIDVLVEVGASVLAIEAKKTLIVDRGTLIEKADRAGISVVAV